MRYKVYTDKDKQVLFSEIVKREFGENKWVTPDNGQPMFLASVHPLKCKPDECGLFECGTVGA